MPKRLPQELRDQVLDAVIGGERPASVARRFDVPRQWVSLVVKRYLETGDRKPGDRTGCRGEQRKSMALREHICRWIASDPMLSIDDMCRYLAEMGIDLTPATIYSHLTKWGFQRRVVFQAPKTLSRSGIRLVSASEMRL